MDMLAVKLPLSRAATVLAVAAVAALTGLLSAATLMYEPAPTLSVAEP